MVFKKSFFKIGKWQSRPPRDPPPPFMANAILNFHFDFLNPSPRWIVAFWPQKKIVANFFSVGTRALWRCPHVLICRSGTPTLFQRWAFFTPSGLRAYPCTFVEAWIIVCVVQGWLPWFYHNFQLSSTVQCVILYFSRTHLTSSALS